MSAQAVGYVYERSPYTGAVFAVHLAVADSVNDQNENKFWLRAHRLARKARISRDRAMASLKQLCEDGFLDLVEQGGGRSRPSIYRFKFPDVDVFYDSRGESVESDDSFKTVASRRSEDPETVESRRESVVSHDRHRTQENPSKNQTQELSLASFDEFWKHYPRKVGKAGARRVWQQRIKDGTDPVAVVEACKQYAAWVAAGGVESLRFVPHPSTWLHRGSEDDDLPDPVLMDNGGSSIRRGFARYRQMYGKRESG